MTAINQTNQSEDQSQLFLLPRTVTESARDFFTEIGTCTVITGCTCFFAANQFVAASIIAFAVAALAINIFSRIVEHVLDGRLSQNAAGTLRAIRHFNTSLLYGTTGNILAHEFGHWAAISLMYKHAKPQITIDKLFGGSTRWINSEFTVIGKILGPKTAQVFIAIAGPLAAVILATIGIFLAMELTNQNSYFRDCLLTSSAFSIVGHITYALSALSANPNDLQQDFVLLWKSGIHPLVSAIGLLAIPLLIILNKISQNQQK